MIASVGLIIALIALRLWWGWYADRQLQAEIDRIVAAGEPIYPEDFDPKGEIPDDQNAAKLLQEAVNSIDLFNERSVTFQAISGNDEPVSRHLDGVRKLLEANAKSLQLTRKARGLTRIDWGLRIRTPAFGNFFSFPFEDYRQLARVLDVAAEYYATTENYDEVASVCADTLFLGDAMLCQPSIISQLVGWPIQGLALDRIERFILVPVGREESATLTQFEKELVRHLIQSLTDDSPLSDGVYRAFLGERMMQVDLLTEFNNGSKTMSQAIGWPVGSQPDIPDVVWKLALAPAVTLDVVRLLQDSRERIRAAQESRWHDVILAPDDIQVSLGTVIQKPFSIGFSQELNGPVEFCLRYLAWRRLTATGLAIRLFRADRGRLPESLEELVPEYLSQVPLDPQSTKPKSFGYLPHADPPIVYGVGENGVDENGKYMATDGYARFRDGDMPFFINGDRPRPVPEEVESNDAADDDGDIKNDEGSNDNQQSEEQEP